MMLMMNLVDDNDDNDIVVFQKTRRGQQEGSWRNTDCTMKRTEFLLLVKR